MTDDQIIKSAQYRKGLSIAFFNATNSAIALVQTDYVKDTNLKEFIVDWRDFFLEEHKNYYADVIASIGQNYNSKETIEKLKTAKTLDELKSIWVGLSEDERRDGDIIKEVNNMKKSYEKI